jgi:hypothetical protein
MYTDERTAHYLAEIRFEVCSHCVERPPGGPPCRPLGKVCGIELNLPGIVDAIHAKRDSAIEPYVEELHTHVCAECPHHGSDQCPCPLDYLQVLVVQAVETVDLQAGPACPSVVC